MKKVLLGTSAIALAGAFATQASAAEWSMKVGGYMEQQLVFTDTDDSNGSADFNGVDFISDSEIHFSPSITLDNGLKFGARIELEGATNSDQIDENYAYVEGSFGRLSIGEDDNVAYIMAYGAPDVTFYNINSGSDTLSIPFAAAFGTTSTFPSVESDSAGIRYFTPRLAGFQLGASYARDANKATDDSNKDENTPGKMFNIWAVAANYVNTFGDVSIAASAGYTRGEVNAVQSDSGLAVGQEFPWTTDSAKITTFNCTGGDSLSANFGSDEDTFVLRPATCAAPSRDPEAYAFGLNIGYGGFTVGGSYANYNETSSDRWVWDVGASYETGPWGFSFTYLNSEIDATKDEIHKFLVGVAYQVAAGVKVNAFGVYEDVDWKSSKDQDAFVLGTGVRLSF